MGRGGAPAREISFVSLVAYGTKVSLLSLSHGGLQLLKPGRAVPNSFLFFFLFFFCISSTVILLLLPQTHLKFTQS